MMILIGWLLAKGLIAIWERAESEPSSGGGCVCGPVVEQRLMAIDNSLTISYFG